MEKILVADESVITYVENQRKCFFRDSGGRLDYFFAFPEKRKQPRIHLMLNGSGDYVAQGQYKWSANCSHLFYDVLSDFLVLRKLVGCNSIIHKPVKLSKQVLDCLESNIVLGNLPENNDNVVPDFENKFSHLDLAGWRFGGHKHSYLSSTIREAFKEFMVKDDSLPKNIIINRKLFRSQFTRNRNISNLADLLFELDDVDNKFTVVELEDLDFRDQIKLFFNAKTVISTHGSALFWLNFCLPNTRVIEIFPPYFRTENNVKRDFWIIANQANLNYSALSVDSVIGNSESAYDLDVVVDCKLMRDLVYSI